MGRGTIYLKPIIKWRSVAILFCLTASLLAGCNGDDDEQQKAQWKAAAEAAFRHNAEIAEHAFEGELKVDDSLLPILLPSDAQLLSPLLSGGLEWKGAVDTDPLRAEAEIWLGSSDDPSTPTVPLLIQDNKLYASVPMVNEFDEYLEIELSEQPENSLFSADVLSEGGTIVERWVEHLMLQANASLYEMQASPEFAPPSGVEEVSPSAPVPGRYEVSVTEENQEQWKTIVSAWLNRGESATEAAWSVLPGGWVAVTVDEAGFAVDYELELTLQQDGENRTLSGAVRKTALNEPPNWTRAVPEKVLPFQNVITFLRSNAPNS